jgi:hypothetical protein
MRGLRLRLRLNVRTDEDRLKTDRQPDPGSLEGWQPFLAHLCDHMVQIRSIQVSKNPWEAPTR